MINLTIFLGQILFCDKFIKNNKNNKKINLSVDELTKYLEDSKI